MRLRPCCVLQAELQAMMSDVEGVAAADKEKLLQQHAASDKGEQHLGSHGVCRMQPVAGLWNWGSRHVPAGAFEPANVLLPAPLSHCCNQVVARLSGLPLEGVVELGSPSEGGKVGQPKWPNPTQPPSQCRHALCRCAAADMSLKEAFHKCAVAGRSSAQDKRARSLRRLRLNDWRQLYFDKQDRASVPSATLETIRCVFGLVVASKWLPCCPALLQTG